ncbi:oxidoreductase molybdopterin binding protein [Rhizobium sp. CF080]|nr:oxidoreductase molybdopterin binding protein [Rhizobium sp. CF080]
MAPVAAEEIFDMPAYRPPHIPASEITPRDIYMSRRNFMGAAAVAGFAFAGADSAFAAPLTASPSAYKVDEKLTPKEAVTTYNNFYEFGVNKDDPAANSGDFKPTPWSVKVDGMVGKPKEFGHEELMKMNLEERTYRMRCVEGWSMVIPWIGFPLSALLDQVDVLGSAKYVSFETVVRPEEMPGQKGFFQPLPWPYIEGLRLDEARHPLAILAVGLYGETLPNPNGAPIRLVVPWKYGFKSSSRSSRRRPGRMPTPANTASIPTSTRRSITRAGARRRNSGSAKAASSVPTVARPCRSTVMPIRWRASMTAST